MAEEIKTKKRELKKIINDVKSIFESGDEKLIDAMKKNIAAYLDIIQEKASLRQLTEQSRRKEIRTHGGVR